MLKELGISAGTVIIILVSSYYIIKWAVKNGIKEYHEDINGTIDKEDMNSIKRMVKSYIESNNVKEAENEVKGVVESLIAGNKENAAEEIEKWYKETIKNKK